MKETPIVLFLKELMRRRKRSPSQMAKDMGISHATVSGWLFGKYKPDNKSCWKLSAYSGIPIEKVLFAAGHLPKLNENSPFHWPEFREYARQKYPEELEEDVITIIEDLIESKRKKRHEKQSAKQKKIKGKF